VNGAVIGPESCRHEIERECEVLIRRLNMSRVHEIAHLLKVRGITGKPVRPSECPIANLFRGAILGTVDDPQFQLLGVSAGTGSVFIRWEWGTLYDHTDCLYGSSVEEFVRRFDCGDWPELRQVPA
jgi:hypothetical protein